MFDTNSVQDRLKKTLDKMGLDPKDPADSLEYFYQLRNLAGTGISKPVLTYRFDDEIFKKHNLILIAISDSHLGNRHSNVPFLIEFVKYALNVPNCVVILNGDLAETATKSSVGMAMFEEDKNLPEQLKLLVEILKPLADAGKILGMGPGNHEERVANLIGINPMQILAEKLDVPYFGYQGYFRLIVNGITYKVALNHGVGGGATQGSKSTSMERQNKVAIADLYITGHTHGLKYHDDLIYYIDDESDVLQVMKRHYVVAGSFLEYWGGYSEMKMLPPSRTGTARIELRADTKDIRITV